jgi:hypothetical protein
VRDPGPRTSSRNGPGVTARHLANAGRSGGVPSKASTQAEAPILGVVLSKSRTAWGDMRGCAPTHQANSGPSGAASLDEPMQTWRECAIFIEKGTRSHVRSLYGQQWSVFPAQHFQDNHIFQPHISTPDDDRHDAGLAYKKTSCTVPPVKPGRKTSSWRQGLARGSLLRFDMSLAGGASYPFFCSVDMNGENSRQIAFRIRGSAPAPGNIASAKKTSS